MAATASLKTCIRAIMRDQPNQQSRGVDYPRDGLAYRADEEPVLPDRSGRIPERARVVVPRVHDRETGTVLDNQGPAYLVRFDDGGEAWYDRASVERDNPSFR